MVSVLILKSHIINFRAKYILHSFWFSCILKQEKFAFLKYSHTKHVFLNSNEPKVFFIKTFEKFSYMVHAHEFLIFENNIIPKHFIYIIHSNLSLFSIHTFSFITFNTLLRKIFILT